MLNHRIPDHALNFLKNYSHSELKMTLSFPYDGSYGYWTQPSSSGEERNYYLSIGDFLHRQIFKLKTRIPSLHIPNSMTVKRAPPSLPLMPGHPKTNFFKQERVKL
jgi:hypothetical protein